MLRFERREGEGFDIGGIARVTISSIRKGNRVKVAVDAPRYVQVLREELVDGPDAGDAPKPYAGMRIVIIEDDDDFALLLDEAFRIHGVGHVHRCSSAEEGRALLSKLAGTEDAPHAVIVDYHLNDGKGETVVSAIREIPSFRRTPVVMLSCASDDTAIDACFDAGANAFMSKPPEFSELLATLGRLLSHWADPSVVA
ncbi:MAG: response regulator [Planctomycetota bacterium]